MGALEGCSVPKGRSKEDRSAVELIPGDEFNPREVFEAVVMPTSIRNAEELSEGAKWAWLVLALSAGKKDREYPGQRAICGQIGVGRARGLRFMQELVDFGLLRTKRCRGSRKRRYVFRWHPIYASERDDAREKSREPSDVGELEHIGAVIKRERIEFDGDG